MDESSGKLCRMVRRLAIGFIVCGVLLHAYTALFVAAGGLSPFRLGLVLWSWVPYALGGALIKRNVGAAAGAALFVLAADGLGFYLAFVNPQGSTSSLVLLFMPMWNLLLVGPVGALLGWLVSRRRISGKDDGSHGPH